MTDSLPQTLNLKSQTINHEPLFPTLNLKPSGFLRMTDSAGVYVEDVFHKALIDVRWAVIISFVY